MLELNLTGLQKGGSLKSPEDETGAMPAETPEEKTESASAGPKLGLSLSSLKAKKDEPSEEIAPEILPEVKSETTEEVAAATDEAMSGQQGSALTEIMSSEDEEIIVLSDDKQEESTEAIAPIVLEDDNGNEEGTSSVLSLSSLKSDSEQAKKVQDKKEEVIVVEQAETEEKKEFFPSFNALASFEDDDVLGLNKNNNLADGESQSIISTGSASIIAEKEEIKKDDVMPSETEHTVESLIAADTESELPLIPADIETTEQITVAEAEVPVESAEQQIPEAQANDTEAIKGDLSKKRAFAGLTPFKKKILIYSVAAFSVCGIGLVALTGTGNKSDHIKANVNEILLPPIKYKEGVDFNINKNNKKNIRKIKVETATSMSGETMTGGIDASGALINGSIPSTGGAMIAVPPQDPLNAGQAPADDGIHAGGSGSVQQIPQESIPTEAPIPPEAQ